MQVIHALLTPCELSADGFSTGVAPGDEGAHRRLAALADAYVSAGYTPAQSRARLAAAVRLGERSRPVLALRLDLERIFGEEVAP